MNKAMWIVMCTAGSVLAMTSLPAQAAGTQSVNPVVTPPPLTLPYSVNVESDKKYHQRMENLDQLASYYHIEWSDPYVFVGEPRVQTLPVKKEAGDGMVVQRMLTPKYYTEVYKVNSADTPATRFVYIDKRNARAQTFDLSANEIARISSLTTTDHHIVLDNIHVDSPAQRRLSLKLARQIIDERICNTVVSGVIKADDIVTISCGDGMSYTQTLAQIERGVAIERRVAEYVDLN